MDWPVLLEWDEEEKVYNVSVPSLPGCLSWGYTKEQALDNIKDAILGYLQVAERHGDTIDYDPSETELTTVHLP